MLARRVVTQGCIKLRIGPRAVPARSGHKGEEATEVQRASPFPPAASRDGSRSGSLMQVWFLLPRPEQLVARWRRDHVRMRRTGDL
jgi:hypothetical protein